MPTLGQHTIHEFRLQRRADLVAALEAFMRGRKETALGGGDRAGSVAIKSDESAGIQSVADAGASSPEDKLGMYAAMFHRILTNSSPAMPVGAVEQATVEFLDADLVEAVAKGEADQELQEGLGVQMALLAAGIGRASGLSPYTVEELKAVFSGEGAVYHDNILLHTLHHLLTADNAREYGPYVLKALPAKTDREDNYTKMFWDDALIMSMLIQVAWRSFNWYPQTGQQFLLQNFFYEALVVGVPVRYWLHDTMAKAGSGARSMMNFFLQAINGSHEEVAIDPIEEDGIALNEVNKEYLRQLTSEQLPTIVQEAYLSALYPDALIREVLGTWVRELLAIMVHLKDGTI